MLSEPSLPACHWPPERRRRAASCAALRQAMRQVLSHLRAAHGNVVHYSEKVRYVLGQACRTNFRQLDTTQKVRGLKTDRHIKHPPSHGPYESGRHPSEEGLYDRGAPKALSSITLVLAGKHQDLNWVFPWVMFKGDMAVGRE